MRSFLILQTRIVECRYRIAQSRLFLGEFAIGVKRRCVTEVISRVRLFSGHGMAYVRAMARADWNRDLVQVRGLSNTDVNVIMMKTLLCTLHLFRSCH